MTAEDKREIREMIVDCMTGIHARTEAKFDIIDNKLDGINNHLEKLNGKVVHHEKQLNDQLLIDARRPSTCPYRDDIETTKKDMEFKKKLNKWLISGLVVMNIVLGMAIMILGLL
jgi:hypothetical protein